ncbi:MAG: hypothetical protein R2724_09565 [Bryobacterales bacterium]
MAGDIQVAAYLLSMLRGHHRMHVDAIAVAGGVAYRLGDVLFRGVRTPSG